MYCFFGLPEMLEWLYLYSCRNINYWANSNKCTSLFYSTYSSSYLVSTIYEKNTELTYHTFTNYVCHEHLHVHVQLIVNLSYFVFQLEFLNKQNSNIHDRTISKQSHTWKTQAVYLTFTTHLKIIIILYKVAYIYWNTALLIL